MAAELPSLQGLSVVRNGHYPRFLPVAPRPEKDLVYRKKCLGCRTNFTLLPNDVIPLHSYGAHLIGSRLEASLAGDADRSQSFYQRHQLIPDEDPQPPHSLKAISWSDRLNDKALRPSHQLFRHWRRKWSRCSRAWLHRLLLACIFAGCDLKVRLGELLEVYVDCPDPMRSVPLALGLVSLLQGQPVASSLATTVLLLGCSSSHKICRAAGRPPPHYGGDLEFQAF